MEKSRMTGKKFYLLSLGATLLLCIYPIIMGAKMLAAYVREGYVHADDYPKYVIPYTPIAVALILAVALMPLAVKLCKKFALPAVSFFGVGMFLLMETLFEQITVFDVREGLANVGSWQAYLCVVTPEAMESIEFRQTLGEGLAERYSPAFKLHFYLIAILIVLSVLGVIYGFSKMVREKEFARKNPLFLQAAAVTLFIGLCILACFTAFYRTGEILISLRSSLLMGLFFIVFGGSAGLYAGSLLYFKKPWLSRLLPALIALATTIIMYVGELVLMGGELFRFGEGFFFAPLFGCPLAPVDFLVILLSGLCTYGLLYLVRKKEGSLAPATEAQSG